MEVKTMPLSELNPAAYNPRKDLQPGDREYEALNRSFDEFGYIEPIIHNKRTGNLVGGHQRLKILYAKGHTEAETVIVDLSEEDEKILNVALNKIKGRWDYEKLPELLKEIDEAGELANTGFEAYELEALLTSYDHISDLMEEDFSDTGKKELETFTMTFTLPAQAREAVDNYVANHENGKTELSTAIINRIKEALA
nr:MAG TPA: Putative modification methylase [Caudoviricetes sp.]